MLLDGINNNILISHLSDLGVYHHESKKWELYQDINMILVLEQKQEIAETVV